MRADREKLHEECGVFGVSMEAAEAAGTTCNGLLALQHRGQEGAGIAVRHGASIVCQKDVGLVGEVLSPAALARLPAARLAVGHVRYSTTGANRLANVQPMTAEYLRGRIAVAHNGNIINAPELRRELEQFGCEFSATSDSEVVCALIAREALGHETIEEAVEAAVRRLRGAFSLVVLTSQGKLIAVRDPWGFRPLCMGRLPDGSGVAFASESCALDNTGFDFVRDVAPGEMIVIDENRWITSLIFAKSKDMGLCIFEYVYFARPDSTLDGQGVYTARVRMGEILAREHSAPADIVCGVPDSGMEAAMGYARASGIPLASGFVKNRYIGRSFIFPSQLQRDAAVRLKLNPLRANVEGRSVVLVDDSVVRGTTGRKIVSSLRAAGAREVHLRISSPPFRYACHFGTDIDDERTLLANRADLAGMARELGVDSLGFISVDGLKKACMDSRLPLCTGCFDRNYPLRPCDADGAQKA